jgi:hypothetical protein
MGIFGKLAYDAGATVGTLLAVRFGIARLIDNVALPAAEHREAASEGKGRFGVPTTGDRRRGESRGVERRKEVLRS